MTEPNNSRGRRANRRKDAPEGTTGSPAGAQPAEGTPMPRPLPWQAKVPGLRIIVSPERWAEAEQLAMMQTGPAEPVVATSSIVDSYESTQVRGEATPWSRPGSALRVNSRAARHGFYAPRESGAPSTTKQAEVLQTALLAPPTGAEGVVNGRDHLSKSTISYDPITAYNAKPKGQISSPNVLVVGDVGGGKSASTKCIFVLRPLVLRQRRAIVFDKKDRNGEGEYAEVTRFMGAEPLKFSAEGSSTRLNLLDPAVVAAGGIIGQADLLLAVTRVVRGDKPADEWEENAARSALRHLLADFEDIGRTPTAADLLPYLGRVPGESDMSAEAKERYHQHGLTMRLALENLLDGFGGIFDGETSANVNLDHKLTTFDISQLQNEGPAVPVIMAIGHMWMLGRATRDRGWRTNVIYEEGWNLIGGPSARLVNSNVRLARGLGFSNIFVIQKGSTIPKGSEGYSVVQEAQTLYAFRHSRSDDAEWVREAFDLDPESTRTLEHLETGHAILKIGDRPETHLEVQRSRWEERMTNTDEGLAGTVSE
ncbi:ATP/GTP-binding protein [Gryllotalpicola protaetiae]|uniref:ATP/GTP-binding protein n=1 Tax=Gryllotalpicola protaetiae TaxID=2419771 RepID=A0A387BS83_9MICO|nr:ATP/GTP-binding protein [Gryllotalpicola protaetiae]AYG05558.1 ATP/GTP-binding protein [Gryllotalpicola protaetiae]